MGGLDEAWTLDAYEEEIEQQLRAQWGGVDIGEGTTGEADVDEEMDVEWTLDSDEEEIERVLEGIAFGDG